MQFVICFNIVLLNKLFQIPGQFTFTTTAGRTEGYFYQCYTCNVTKDTKLVPKKSVKLEGCHGCPNCIKECHANHIVKFIGFGPGLCTFSQTGRNYHAGEFYECYTCDMTNDYSICFNCIKKCHANHEVKYVRFDDHYCDCGEAGKDSCLILPGNFNK